MAGPPSSWIIGIPQRPWSTAPVEGCPFGPLVSAVCPEPTPSEVVDALGAEERAYVATLASPQRRNEWMGGRLCLGRALSALAVAWPPLLPTATGAPTVPAGFAASLSHKGPLAVALAAKTAGGVGVDVDCASPRDLGLARKVLTRSERARVGDRDDQSAARFILAHFSVKEAVYKALLPEDQEDLEFDDIDVVVERLEEQVWVMLDTNLLNRATAVQAALLIDGDWVVAAAIRGP